MDGELVRLAVRVTARLSAIAWLAALALCAIRYRTEPRRIVEAIRLLVAFIVLHTIHFGTVVWLAVLTAGENVDERGGWPAMLGAAAAFYLAAFSILRMWGGVATAQPVSDAARGAAQLGVLFIAAIFLNSYVSRTESMPIYWIWTMAMVLVVIVYLVRSARRPSGSP